MVCLGGRRSPVHLQGHSVGRPGPGRERAGRHGPEAPGLGRTPPERGGQGGDRWFRANPTHYAECVRGISIVTCETTHVLFHNGKEAAVSTNHDKRSQDNSDVRPQNPGATPTTDDERARDTYAPADKVVGTVLNVIS